MQGIYVRQGILEVSEHLDGQSVVTLPGGSWYSVAQF